MAVSFSLTAPRQLHSVRSQLELVMVSFSVQRSLNTSVVTNSNQLFRSIISVISLSISLSLSAYRKWYQSHFLVSIVLLQGPVLCVHGFCSFKSSFSIFSQLDCRETEYCSIAQTFTELTWIHALLTELQVPFTSPDSCYLL